MASGNKWLRSFCRQGQASFILGGQWGSEAKGCASAWTANELAKQDKYFDIVTTNAGAQAGHTSTHEGKRRVVFHLPTAPLITGCGAVYLNAGSIIDPEGLKDELKEFSGDLFIHPLAAVITDECKEAEQKNDSAQTKIASTRKGVGEALSRKILRSGAVAKDDPFLKRFVRRLDLNLLMSQGNSVLVEVPQGVSLSLNHSIFYPHCTSRDCIPSSAMGDAAIHPDFYNSTMVVLRTYPIRVGNIIENGETLGVSGGHFPDQHEVSWSELGVDPEITTVTKRVRRVFSFSAEQVMQTFALCRPDIIFLTFCNYVKYQDYFNNILDAIRSAANANYLPMPRIVFEYGPSTEDVTNEYEVGAARAA